MLQLRGLGADEGYAQCVSDYGDPAFCAAFYGVQDIPTNVPADPAAPNMPVADPQSPTANQNVTVNTGLPASPYASWSNAADKMIGVTAASVGLKPGYGGISLKTIVLVAGAGLLGFIAYKRLRRA